MEETQEEYIEIEKTCRGFAIGRFKDSYGAKCSIQKSSAACEDYIWLGVSDPEPKVLACHAEEAGTKQTQPSGWQEFPISEHVLINTRMHLNQEQAAELIKVLTRFVETGEILA